MARDAYMSENNTVISFFNECMTERQQGKLTDCCSTGRIYKVYKAWCGDNNNGYAKTASEFRKTLADHLDTTFADMSVKRNNGTYYQNYTLTMEAKDQYAQAYGYDSTDFLA